VGAGQIGQGLNRIANDQLRNGNVGDLGIHYRGDGALCQGLAKEFSRKLFENGVFAMGIGFPTVPRGMARIRVMNTAAHTKDDLDFGLEAFAKVGRELGVIS
jgi:7-keto-8-aminopelargonate synthetase-like enzyme